MKVESNSLHPVATNVRAAKPSVENAKPKTDKSKTEKLDTDSMRSRMSQWFAKAGIQQTRAVSFEKDLGKRIHRHQLVKAQRKMQNLENILELALEYSLEQGKQEDLDPDWFFSFIDMAEEIHSRGMQELWGKIFAVEVSRPGTFSLRTLQVLKKLTHKDAQIFRTAVSLASRKKGEYAPKLVFGYHQKPTFLSFLGLKRNHQLNLAEHGLAYPDLLSLMDMGLIYSSEIESGELNPDSRSQWRCGKHIIHLSPKQRGLTLNYYKFTATGAELFKLVSGNSSSNYLDALKETLSSGFEID